MAFVIADRVRETTTTIGTGSITLAGAYTSFQSFSAAIGNGNNTYYTIASASSGEWEVGIGTYSSGGNLLSRDTVLSSSNAGNLVNFSVGSKDVFVTQPASRAIFVQNAGTGLQTGTTAFTASRVLYANATSTTTTSANLTFDGTTLTANALTTTSTVTINGGTANGVAYLNGSKVLTSGSALTFDGTTLGVGVAGSAWDTLKAIDLGSGGAVYGTAGQGGITSNAFYGASGFVYKATNGAGLYQLVADSHRWSTAASGTGGTAISFAEQMRLTSTGLGIGTSSPSAKLHVSTSAAGIAEPVWLNNSQAVGAGVGSRLVFTGTTSNNGLAAIDGAFAGATTADGGYMVFNTRAVTSGALTERMRLDASGNLGLGVTPSAWRSVYKALQTNGGSFYGFTSNDRVGMSQNAYVDATSFQWTYTTTAAATNYLQISGEHQWYRAASGTAGNAITFTQAMTLDASGNLGVGSTSPTNTYSRNVQIDGSSSAGIRFTSTSYTAGFDVVLSAGDAYLLNRNNTSLIFSTNATERARITSGGDFLVGTTIANAKVKLALTSPGTLGTVVNVGSFGSSGVLSVGGVTNNTDGVYFGTGDTGGTGVASGIGFLREASGWNSALAFYTNNITSGPNGVSAITERMRLDSSGNLGLGVTPSAWESTAKAFQFGSLGYVARGSSGQTMLGYNNYLNTSNQYIYSATSQASRYEQISGEHRWFNAASGTAGNAITFTQAMTLDASGRLLIGTTSVGGATRSRIFDNSNSSTILVVGGSTYGVRFGDNGVGGVVEGVDTTGSSSFQPLSVGGSEIRFTTSGTERARITSGGDLLVGTTSNTINANGVVVQSDGVTKVTSTSDPFWVNRRSSTGTLVNFYNDSVLKGTISTDGTNVAYNTSSDYRLKDNPQPLTGSGAFIDALQPKTWDWKTDGTKGVGFIAHEVQEVSPSSVVGTKDAVDEEGNPIMQGMEYGSAEFIANIVAELQSLRARVAQLESKGA